MREGKKEGRAYLLPFKLSNITLIAVMSDKRELSLELPI